MAVSFSSKSTYGCTPERVVDGVTTNMLWQDGTSRSAPGLDFAHLAGGAKIGRVVTYSPTLADFEIQVPGGEGWRTVATVRNATTDAIEATFAPVETKRSGWITRLRQERHSAGCGRSRHTRRAPERGKGRWPTDTGGCRHAVHHG